MIPIYLEVGQKRVIAAALDWPGWCRGGHDEAAAVAALLDYAPRYARAITATGLPFDIPAAVDDFAIVERLPGNSGTDFARIRRLYESSDHWRVPPIITTFTPAGPVSVPL